VTIIAYGFGEAGPPRMRTVKTCGEGLHVFKNFAGGMQLCECCTVELHAYHQGAPIDIVVPYTDRWQVWPIPSGVRVDMGEEE